jgi:hypothetical protein
MYSAREAHFILGDAFSASAHPLAAGSNEASAGARLLLLVILAAVVITSSRLAIAAIAPVTDRVRAYKTAITILIIMLGLAVLLISI